MSAFLPNDDLVFMDPVPSDIEVSQSITPAPINKVAEVIVIITVPRSFVSYLFHADMTRLLVYYQENTTCMVVSNVK